MSAASTSTAAAQPTSMRDSLLLPVHADWVPIFEQYVDWQKIIANIDALQVRFTPAPENVFRVFMNPPSAIKVIIIGQDPYPSPGSATGLAFANPVRISKDRKYNPSLLEVMRVSGCSDPTLYSWMMQGVMLLNTILTATESGQPLDPLHKFWVPFVQYIVDHLCRLHGARLHLVMWGEKAASFNSLGTMHNVRCHTWAHPSPLATNKLPAERAFGSCPHFRDITEIKWNTRQFELSWPNYLIFTDGACVGNGSPDAKASSAYAILRNVGTYAEPQYEKLATRHFHLELSEPRTNQRAELRAIQKALFDPDFLSSPNKRLIGLVSDSAYSINILNRVNNYSANKDLIDSMLSLSSALNVQYAHVNSHQHSSTERIFVPTMANYDTFMSNWNNVVDQAADKLLRAASH